MTASDHLKHRTGSLGGDQDERLCKCGHKALDHVNFGKAECDACHECGQFDPVISDVMRIADLEAALAQKTRECEEKDAALTNAVTAHVIAANDRESLEAQLEQLGRQVAEFLIPEFLQAMNDIGRYGFEKYGADSFQARRRNEDRSRMLKRCEPQAIADHAREHFSMYLNHEPHDHFGTDKHQLAAVAFNAMMEFYFAGLK